MRFQIITLFPEIFSGFLGASLVGRAIKSGLLEVELIDLRDFGLGRHRQVDDRPFGGGPGMLLMVEPLDKALASLAERGHVLLTDPRGRMINGAWARDLAARRPIVTMICGNYEGVDFRVNERLVDEEICIGPYITSGGETAAMVVLEVVSRFLPGFMGKDASGDEESYDASGLPEYPQYSRPEIYKNWPVPQILLSGNHPEIKKWRNSQRWEMLRRKNERYQ